MAFLKAFTVFIVCISIFKIIISNSTIVGNKNNSTDYNVLLTGDLFCLSCNDSSVTILVYERNNLTNYDGYKCNSPFFINRTLDKPNIEDYKLSFYLICGYEVKARVEKKHPLYMQNISGTYIFEFGYINLKNTQKRKNRKRRNGLRRSIF